MTFVFASQPDSGGFVALGIRFPALLGGDPCIADHTAYGGSFWRHDGERPLFCSNLQIDKVFTNGRTLLANSPTAQKQVFCANSARTIATKGGKTKNTVLMMRPRGCFRRSTTNSPTVSGRLQTWPGYTSARLASRRASAGQGG
jgi:hypothetical protein